jgi:hypothetical protein
MAPLGLDRGRRRDRPGVLSVAGVGGRAELHRAHAPAPSRDRGGRAVAGDRRAAAHDDARRVDPDDRGRPKAGRGVAPGGPAGRPARFRRRAVRDPPHVRLRPRPPRSLDPRARARRLPPRCGARVGRGDRWAPGDVRGARRRGVRHRGRRCGARDGAAVRARAADPHLRRSPRRRRSALGPAGRRRVDVGDRDDDDAAAARDRRLAVGVDGGADHQAGGGVGGVSRRARRARSDRCRRR